MRRLFSQILGVIYVMLRMLEPSQRKLGSSKYEMDENPKNKEQIMELSCSEGSMQYFQHTEKDRERKRERERERER